jgi:hypothetical protein
VALDNLSEFVRFVRENAIASVHIGFLVLKPMDGIYCPTCGDIRRVDVLAVHTPITESKQLSDPTLFTLLVPSVFRLTCVQCSMEFTVLIYQGPDGPRMAVFPAGLGGLATPRTPTGVAFYLDQAYRAQSIGAHSAAVAMYRAALDYLLYDQGYRQPKDTLGQRLGRLEADIGSGAAKEWAMKLDTDLLRVLKELGDRSIHPSDGAVGNQAALDTASLNNIQAALRWLLDLVYEQPAKQRRMLEDLQKSLSAIKGEGKP